MHSSSATRPSTGNADGAAGRPRIGVLGVMQHLYDAMLPGITERQAAYAGDVAGALGEDATVVVSSPVKDRDQVERAMRELEGAGLGGLLVVMLTYGPAMNVARSLAETRLPVCVVNTQPVAEVSTSWDMADLTYNQGIHGAQDTANALVRAGRPFGVVTGDWRSASFADDVGRWSRAAAAVTRWRALKVAVFGYSMNGMGDIHVDLHTLLTALGPRVDALATGALHRAATEAEPGVVAQLLEDENGRFEVDPRLTVPEREDHARMQIGLERILSEGGYDAYSTHFGAIAEDGRFGRLPLAAASSLMARGYAYAAEGDAVTAALMAAARTLLGPTQFTEMYAMDFARDAFLMSHMGEGNWALARADRPVRLIKRSLGIGGLDDPPTFLFQYETGPCTLAALLALPDGRFRLVVSEGEILDTEELPGLEMPYGFFRPASGVRACADGWLGAGGPHHQVLSRGHRAGDWRTCCAEARIELVVV